MDAYVALLRAVNVGGTGKLPMAELRAMCVDAGFGAVATYIASGNVVFTARGSEAQVKEALEERLAAYAGRSVGVMVRTAGQLADVLAGNPFPDDPANRTVAIFLDDPPPAHALDDVKNRKDERLSLGTREIYVAYGSGMGASKLRIPTADRGTARNMNTIAKLTDLAAQRTA